MGESSMLPGIRGFSPSAVECRPSRYKGFANVTINLMSLWLPLYGATLPESGPTRQNTGLRLHLERPSPAVFDRSLRINAMS